MANPVTITTTITYDDGSTVEATVNATVAQPTDTEVDVLLSDGTTKKFVPAE